MRVFTRDQRALIHGMIERTITEGAQAKKSIPFVAKEIAKLFEQDVDELLLTLDAHMLKVVSSRQEELDGLETQAESAETFIKKHRKDKPKIHAVEDDKNA